MTRVLCRLLWRFWLLGAELPAEEGERCEEGGGGADEVFLRERSVRAQLAQCGAPFTGLNAAGSEQLH